MADELTPPSDATPPTSSSSGASAAEEQTIVGLTAKLAAADRKITALSTKIPQYEKLLADKEFKIGEFDTQLKETTVKATTFEQQLTKLQADLKIAQDAAATATKAVDRTKLLASEYSDLMDFEADGLLDANLAGDDFKAYLDKFRAKVGTDRKQAVKTTLNGSSPSSPPPRNDGEVTVAVLDKQIDEAFAKNDNGLALKLSLQRAGLFDKANK